MKAVPPSVHDGAPPAADISENYACKVQHRAAEFKSSLADVAPTKAVTVKAKKIRICSTKGIRNEITKHLYHIDCPGLCHASVWLSSVLTGRSAAAEGLLCCEPDWPHTPV